MSPAFFLSLLFLLSFSLSHFLFLLSRLSVRWPSAAHRGLLQPQGKEGFSFLIGPEISPKGATLRGTSDNFAHRSDNIPPQGIFKRHLESVQLLSTVVFGFVTALFLWNYVEKQKNKHTPNTYYPPKLIQSWLSFRGVFVSGPQSIYAKCNCESGFVGTEM